MSLSGSLQYFHVVYLLKATRKQRATGRTRDGANFPLSIAVEVDSEDEDDLDEVVYRGVIWVFANISGLITFLPDGSIHSINENFSLMLFGYKTTELVGKVSLIVILVFYVKFLFKTTDQAFS